ncbi:DUF501 domain-containing protein [Phytohabitans rumicis]|uniref:Uncharacterized protein n=1 Tax=Phytohabitans rumicis TaxID=1076125 RepID=A0A6V8KR93_9ACTN|nr:DUF501 domain-containing protein [Phytohabitans rumicis]GFJ86364.1 hypothetical protein Prum_000060 [Phytohabitans rumicis]
MESAGLMDGMEARLATDPDLARRYRTADEGYLAWREEIEGRSASGMPVR